MHLEPGLLARLRQAHEEIPPSHISPEDLLPAIAAAHDAGRAGDSTRTFTLRGTGGPWARLPLQSKPCHGSTAIAMANVAFLD